MSVSAAEDPELRDLVMQVLESNGTLGKLRSQLRASVFLALDSNHALKTVSADKDTSKIETLLKSSDGMEVLGLCRDLLSACNLTYSMNVFDAEIKNALNGTHLPNRTEIVARLGISHDLENIPSSAPLLSSIVAIQKNQELAERFAVTADNIKSARQFFSRHESFGCVSYESLLEALGSAFPSVDKHVLTSYCDEHYSEIDSKTEANIDFEEFLTLYCYFLSIQNFSLDKEDDHKSSASHQREKRDGPLTDKKIPHKLIEKAHSSSQEDRWSDDKDDDLSELLPKIPSGQNSRRNLENLLAVEKTFDSLNLEESGAKVKSENAKPGEKITGSKFDTHDNPDDVASFFNEKPPWETEKVYADDFVADEDPSPRKSIIEDDCKVTDLSEEEEDVTMDEAPSGSEHRPSVDSDHNRPHSPNSSATDFSLNVDSSAGRSHYPNLANHPRLANVQFLEDVESTKF